MFIKSLKLKNFQTIRDAEFRFRKGIICFTGNNGEGKSTVLHAIVMLLFNSYDGNLKDYITWGEKEFQISMEFSHEGKNYSEFYSYSLTRGSERQLQILDTGEIFTGNSCVSKLAEILDPSQASAAIVAMENQQNLVNTTPSQRREYLKKIYSLEFKEELEKIAQDVSRTEEDIIRLQSKKDVLVASEYPLKTERELPDRDEYEKSVENLRRIDQRIAEAQKKAEELDTLRKEEHELSDEVIGTGYSLSKLRETLDRLTSENQDLKEEIASLEAEDPSAEIAQETKEEQESYELEKQTLQKQILQKQSELETAPVPVRVSRKPYETVAQRETELSYAYEESNRKIKILSQGKCPTCGREISSSELEAEERKNHELKEELERMKERKKVEQERLDELNSYNEDAKQQQVILEKTLNEAVHSLSSLEESHKNKVEKFQLLLEQKKLRIENKISQNRIRIEGNDKVYQSSCETMNSLSSQKSSAEKKLEQIRKKMEVFEDPYGLICLLEQDKEEPQRIVDEYESAVSYNRSIQVYNEEMLKKTIERDRQVAELEEELLELSRKKTMMAVAKGLVQREFPSFVISRMVETLSAFVNEFLQKVYPKYQISIEESKNSLNFLFGEYKSDVKMASGFEKSVFSLAYMYALGKIQSYGLLICDEGDAAASDENATRFYRTLGHSLEWIDQIMCITHKEEIKELLRNDFHAQVFHVEKGEYQEEVV